MNIDEGFIGYIDLDLMTIAETTVRKGESINTSRGIISFHIYGSEKENSIPHFHIRGNNLKNDFTIMLHKPVYFDHENYNIDRLLDSKERKIIDKWLRQLCDRKEFGMVSNWEYMCAYWIKYQGAGNIVFPKTQPNYKDLRREG